tara:strand:+ start:292 stop:507 length:216 start_codon:yes stop_codon:yes gene_type:complete
VQEIGCHQRSPTTPTTDVEFYDKGKKISKVIGLDVAAESIGGAWGASYHQGDPAAGANYWPIDLKNDCSYF